MAFPPQVTIAIPTVNAGALLNACLAALNRQTFRDFEVVIVDNGKTRWKSEFPFVFEHRIATPGSNIGFGAAVNLAIRTSSAPLIATLNDDTEPDADWLAALVRELQADPRVGMCASKIRLFESGLLDSAGMLISFDGSSKQRGSLCAEDSFPLPEDALCPSGCAALYRRAMLEETGLFDEDYFLYCEDTDLGLRARWLGWRCRYAPGAGVRHHYSQTAGAVSALKAYFVERNRLWVALKAFPAIVILVFPFAALLRYFWQLAAVHAGQGAASEFVASGHSVFSAGRIVARAHWETLCNLPPLLRKRAAIRRTARIGSVEFIRLMYRYRIAARKLAQS